MTASIDFGSLAGSRKSPGDPSGFSLNTTNPWRDSDISVNVSETRTFVNLVGGRRFLVGLGGRGRERGVGTDSPAVEVCPQFTALDGKVTHSTAGFCGRSTGRPRPAKPESRRRTGRFGRREQDRNRPRERARRWLSLRKGRSPFWGKALTIAAPPSWPYSASGSCTGDGHAIPLVMMSIKFKWS
jgi:hypothetical protein